MKMPADSQPCTTKPVVSQKAANLTDNADMVMVPREPTEDMIQAAAEAWDATPGMWDAFQAAIKAGIAAAPAPVVPFDFAEWHGNLMMLADAYWESSTAARHRYREQLRAHALNAGQHWKARAVLSAAPVVGEPQPGVLDPDCNYMAPKGKVCNKCGRIHRGIGGGGK